IAKMNIDDLSENIFEFGEKMLTEEFREYLQKDKDRRETFKKIFEILKNLILKELKNDIEKVFTPWFLSIIKNKSLQEKSAATFFLKIIKIAEHYNIHLPREIILFFRTLSIVDMIALQLSPQFDMIKALNSFFGRYPLEQIKILIEENKHAREIEREILSISDNAKSDWESFKEILALEKEKMGIARERLTEMIFYYAERYDDIKLLLKAIK
ncbi:MAG: hypothetical protein AB1643_02235, partial [Patescibacteria group bacterium]